MEEAKEKPKYNIWQNSCYVLRTAWQRRKSVLFVIVIQIILAVSISTIGIFLPKVVVEQITNEVSIETLIITIIVFTLTTTILSAMYTYFKESSWVGRAILRNCVFEELLNKLMDTDYANLEKQDFNDYETQTAEQISTNASTTEAIYGIYEALGTNILGFVVYVLLLVSINPIVLIITGVTSIIGYFVREWANKWEYLHNKEDAANKKRLRYLVQLGSRNQYSKDIRLFSMLDWIKDLQNSTMKVAFNFSKKVGIRHFIADAVDCIATFLREGVAYGYLIWQVINGQITPDMFVLYFAAISGFSGYIMGIFREFANLSRHSLNYCKVRAFLEYPDEFNYENGESITYKNNESEKYSLEVRNVSFKYTGSDKYILKNINLKIENGEKLAIVGLNGAGKTTLIKLISGLYDPTEGEILLNGKNIKVFNRRDYYKLFTVVFQEFFVLPKSIAENVAQVESKYIDKEKVKKVLELADIDKKVYSLKDKENSLLLSDVVDDAVNMSGGEMQKLMLARALYKNSPILILDEPTSALDPIAESKLYNRYNELAENKTSIYISHRLASTRFCDKIILLGEQGIIESGTHEELLNKKGKYFDLFEIQSKYYKEEEAGLNG